MLAKELIKQVIASQKERLIRMEPGLPRNFKDYKISSSSSIMAYLSYFVDAWLFFFIPKFSYSNKIQLFRQGISGFD